MRPAPSRNVFCPLLSVVTVPASLPLASRNVVCADAAVANASRMAVTSAIMVGIRAVAAPNQAARSSRMAHTVHEHHTAARHRVKSSGTRGLPVGLLALGRHLAAANRLHVPAAPARPP